MPSTVTVGFCKGDVNWFGPFHSQDTPPVGELPMSVALPEIQSIVSPTAVAPGRLMSCNTVRVEVDVQPLEPVTTTVKLPGMVVVTVAVVPMPPFGPVHA